MSIQQTTPQRSFGDNFALWAGMMAPFFTDNQQAQNIANMLWQRRQDENQSYGMANVWNSIFGGPPQQPAQTPQQQTAQKATPKTLGAGAGYNPAQSQFSLADAFQPQQFGSALPQLTLNPAVLAPPVQQPQQAQPQQQPVAPGGVPQQYPFPGWPRLWGR